MIYLYIKTHNITGLKYLGKTIKNPFKYRGSGKYWLRHLNKHGENLSTEIIFETENEEELKNTGIYFSKLYNVVESEEWANLKEEAGDGGFEYINISPELRKKAIINRKEKYNGYFRSDYKPKYPSEEVRKFRSERMKKDNPNYGGLKEEHKEKLKLSALNRKKIECEFCKRIIAVNTFYKYHGEMCKSRN